MRWSSTLVLLPFALSLGCVQVRKSSSLPVGQSIASSDGPTSSVDAMRHFEPIVTQNVVRVRNISYFDLGSCFPPPPLVTDVFSDEQLLGTLTATRPAVLECLVSPAHRGRKERTLATVSAVARPGAGVEASVSGENLTSAGELCVLKAVRPALHALPVLPQGWPAAAAQVEFVHGMDTLPAVTTGENAISEAAGSIRLAMPSFCACFEPWLGSPPRQIEGNVALKSPATGVMGSGRMQGPTPPVHPWKVTFLGALGPAEKEVTSCLHDKLMAMEFRAPELEVDVPFYFQFIDSRRDGAVPDLPAWLQHKQLEAVRNRRFAEMLLALGARSSAARAYDALVRRYQADRSVKFETLSQSCAGLLQSDDAWTQSVERKLEAERLALATARELGHEPVHEAVIKQIAETEQSLASAAEVRLADERACPQKVYGRAPRKDRPQQPLLQVTPFKP